MLTAFTLVFTGCGETESPPGDEESSAETATVSSALLSNCRPDHNYTTCLEIDLSKVEYWQDTLPNPGWRYVQPSSDPDLDYEVTVSLDKLNGGVIPTAPGQGVYDDFDDYYDAYSNLMGVDPRTDDFVVTVIGSTAKLGSDGGPITRTTGVFEYDALSDADGSIIIDGVSMTNEFINTDRIHHFTQEVDSGTSQYTVSEPSLTPLAHEPFHEELVDSSLLADGYWRADLKKFTRDFDVIGSTTVVTGKNVTQLSGVRTSWGAPHQGLFSCVFRWIPDGSGDFLAGVLRRICNPADYLALDQEIVDPYIHADYADTGIYAIETIHNWTGDRHPQSRESCGFGFALFDSQELELDDDPVFTDTGLDDEDCPEVFDLLP